MKNFWRNIFVILFSITLLGIISLPLLLRIPFVFCHVAQYITPLRSKTDSFLALIGTFLGSTITITGAMWQSERNIKKKEESKSLTYLRNIRSELQENINNLKLVKMYFDVNDLKQVVFYPENNEEFWTKHDNEGFTVNCNNNLGIMNIKILFNKKALIDETLISEEDKKVLNNLYMEFYNYNIANGINDGLINKLIPESKDAISIIDKNLK